MVLKIHPFPGQAAWSMPRCDSEDDDPPEVAGAMPVPPVPVPRGGRSSEDLQNLAMENAWHQRTLWIVYEETRRYHGKIITDPWFPVDFPSN